MKNSRFELLNEIGGFLFWIFIKFGRTKLDDELKEQNVPRNILVFCISLVILSYTFYKLQQ